MSDMESILSKLKLSGRFRFWHGTIEIGEYELHEICREIEAEYDKAVTAMNRAYGKYAQLESKIIRCRDCKYHKHNSFHRCDLHTQAVEVEPDGFCSWGEPKEVEE